VIYYFAPLFFALAWHLERQMLEKFFFKIKGLNLQGFLFQNLLSVQLKIFTCL